MKTKTLTVLGAVAALSALFAGAAANAQAIEAVYSLTFDSTDTLRMAMDELFKDGDMRGNKATLYESDFGVANGATHVIAADYDNYAVRDGLDAKRTASHGWAKYELATQGSKLVAADLAIVLDDYGKRRHEAGYLVVFLMQVRDINTYRVELKKLEAALDNPGVFRLVAVRSGSTAVTHAVLVGGSDFASTNVYLDKLFASEAYAEFVAAVGAIRTLQGVEMYRRVGAWGY